MLFANLRREGATGGPTPLPGDGSVTPASKRSKSWKPTEAAIAKRKAGRGAGVGSGGEADGGSRGKESAPVSMEAEASVKEGKVDVTGLRRAILKIAEAVPERAWSTGQWRKVSYPAWRAYVLVATGPRELMQVWTA